MGATGLDAEQEREIQSFPASQSTLTLPDLGALGDTNNGMSGHLLFLFNLARETRAREVVEIGLGGANSALALLFALRDTGGRLTSVELQARSEAQRRIRESGLEPHWKLVEAPSDTAIEQVRSQAPIDILLIDGLHSYGQCRRDYFGYAPLVRDGGYVLFHDSSTIRGVIDFTAELRRRDLGGVNLDYSNGLFVLRKQGEVIW